MILKKVIKNTNDYMFVGIFYGAYNVGQLHL